MSSNIDSILNCLIKSGETPQTIDCYKALKTAFQDGVIPNEKQATNLISFINRDFMTHEESLANAILCMVDQWCKYENHKHYMAIVKAITHNLVKPGRNEKLMNDSALCLKNILNCGSWPQGLNESAKIKVLVGNRICDLLENSQMQQKLSDLFLLNILDISQIIFENKSDVSSFEIDLLAMKIELGLSHHKSKSVRQKANNNLSSHLESWNSDDLFKDHFVDIIPAFKNTFIEYQKKLTGSEELLVEVISRQCLLLMNFFGIRIKKTSRLFNAMLPIMEKGFGSLNEDVKVATLQFWKTMLFHFSKDLNVISSMRYIKLFVQPLKSTKCDTSEKTMKQKINTYWFLICSVKDKLFDLFTMLCLPLLHTCLGNLSNTDSLSCILSPQNANRRSNGGLENKLMQQLLNFGLSNTSKGKPTKLLCIQLMGIEVLLHLMTRPNQKIDVTNLTLQKLNLSTSDDSNLFTRYSLLFLEASNEIFKFLGHKAKYEILFALWITLNENVKQVISHESMKKKKYFTEIFNSYFLIINNCLVENYVPIELGIKMITDCSMFPENILSSTFFGNCKNAIASTPASSLLHLVLSKPVVKSIQDNDNQIFLTCVKKLFICCLSGKHILRFLKTIVGVFKKLYCDKLSLKTMILLIEIWEELALLISDYIKKTQEINEGDAAEHDFSTMYDLLEAPQNLLLVNIHEQIQIPMPNWKSFMESFIWASNLTSTCTENEVALLWLGKVETMLQGDLTQHLYRFYLDSVAFVIKQLIISENMKSSDVANVCKVVKDVTDKSSKFEDEKDYSKIVECLEDLIMKKMHDVYLPSAFVHLMPTLNAFILSLGNQIFVDVDIEEVIVLTLCDIFDKIQRLFPQNPNSISQLLKCDQWNEVLFNGLSSSNMEINMAISSFYCEVIAESIFHKDFCQKFSSELKDKLEDVYAENSLVCPWASISSVSKKSYTPKHKLTNQSPKVCYGVYQSPKKRSFSQLNKEDLSQFSKESKVAKKHSNTSQKKNLTFSTNDDQGSKSPKTENNKDVEQIRKTTSGSIVTKAKNKLSVDKEITEELEVTPLDESYEYVTVADLSVNHTLPNKAMDESIKDVSSSDISTEIEDDASIENVNMLDMSCGQSFCNQSKLENSHMSDIGDEDQGVANNNELKNETTVSSIDDDDSYLQMADMSCNVSRDESKDTTDDDNDTTCDDFDKSEYIMVADMSCNPDVSMPNSNETSCVSVIPDSPSHEDLKINEENNSLISNDESSVFVDADNSDVLENAHSTLKCSPESKEAPSKNIRNSIKILATSPVIINTEQSDSPTSKSILKRQVPSPSPICVQTPPLQKRRVSFAFPISVSKKADGIQTSPKSTVNERKQDVQQSVNRKLSLTDEKRKKTEHVPQSPLSLRSPKVAAAIASIRAKNGKNSSCLFPDTKLRDVTDLDLQDLPNISSKGLMEIIQRATSILLHRERQYDS